MSGRRGQLLLIAGLGLAMTLVVLAIVLNTVIFTQNLATRDAVDTRTPIEFANSVDQGVGGLMVEANHWNTTNYGTLDSAFREAVTTWAGNVTYLAASKGTSADVSLEGTTNGTRVVQSTRGPWTNQSGSADWTMVESAESTRRFHVNVTNSSLNTTDGSSLSTSNAFRINVSETSGTDAWMLYIYENSSNPDPVDVTVVPPSGPKTSCSATSTQPFIDVTDAAINDTACDFSFAENISTPYNISVAYGTNVDAKYTFVVDTDYSSFTGASGGHYDLAPAYTSPYAVHAIYAAEVNVSVERTDIRYVRTVTVAPEDVPTDERYNVTT